MNRTYIQKNRREKQTLPALFRAVDRNGEIPACEPNFDSENLQ